MNLCANLLNPVSGFVILVFWSQNFKSAFSTNDTVTEHVDALEQNFVRNTRAAYQPITEVKAMTFGKIKANLEEARIITTSDIFKTRVECASFCLSTKNCFAFQFDETKFKCILMEEYGVCTSYKDSETFIYAMNDNQKTIPKCPCKTKEGEKCIFPFKWWLSEYDSCVTCSNLQCTAPDTWCATELENDRTYEKWGVCDPSCDVAAVNGGWSEWGRYTDCSATCDTGTKSRSRKCTHPAPSSGGSECAGDTLETENCFLEKCLPACVKITTGSELYNDGYLQVNMNGNVKANGKYGKGEVVIGSTCLVSLKTLTLKNSKNDAWVGKVEIKVDGKLVPIDCVGCTGLSSLQDGFIVVDGNSDSEKRSDTHCFNGVTCSLTWI